ncbi:MAG: hypothetical protein J6Q39_03695 [Bacteroidales bacterium]|nr:hypothetical protein [Bacteroidales bacterium]
MYPINHYIPMNYESINVDAGTYRPSGVKSYNNQTFRFWEKALFERACSTLIITVPDEWKEQKNLMYYSLFAAGFFGCGRLPEVGAWFNPGTLYGFNFYYNPTHFILCNPALGYDKNKKNGKKLEIGKECQVCKLTPYYSGIWDIISYYAEKLATLDVAINSAIVNSKFAYMVGAKNKAAAAVIKKLFDKVNSGEPAVFFDAKLANDGTDKEEPWQFLDRKVKESYIITDLLKDFQTVLNNFDTEVGIPTIPYEKKERMVTSEAESKITDSTSRSAVWFDTLKNSFEIANEFMQFESGKLEVKLRFEGGVNNGNSEDNTVRNVQMDAAE